MVIEKVGEERLKWTLWKEIVKFVNWEGGRRKTEINSVKGNSKVWELRRWEKKEKNKLYERSYWESGRRKTGDCKHKDGFKLFPNEKLLVWLA